jgi:hypothetical protein
MLPQSVLRYSFFAANLHVEAQDGRKELGTSAVGQIEASATYDEFPPWLNVETEPADWRTYLTHRTTAVLRRTSTSTPLPPNPQSGSWQPIYS